MKFIIWLIGIFSSRKPKNTVQKFLDFQILREINFDNFGTLKSFEFKYHLLFFHISLVQNSPKITSKFGNTFKFAILELKNPANEFHVKFEWKKNY